MQEKNLLNLIDANIDRAREGLRVIEDVCRYEFKDKKLMLALKDLRHAITETISKSSISIPKLIIARERRNDLGEKTFTESEKKRENLSSLILANIQRAEESLRVLEETFKLFDKKSARKFKALRFKAYELEEKIINESEKQKKVKLFNKEKLYLVLTAKKKSDYLKIAKKALNAGIKLIQLRANNLSDSEIIAIGKKLRLLTKNKALLLIDNRVDLCLLLDADGVHLGQKDLSIKEARKLLGSSKIIGKSTHSLKQALKAEKEADYISVGPIFKTKSVPYKVIGLKPLKQVIKKARIPVVAIGGINEKNVNKIIKIGVKKIAVISAIVDAINVEKAVKKLLFKLR
jgi:thiamine-phosphate pyrophosphorylase